MRQFNKAFPYALITHHVEAQFSLPENTKQSVAQLQIADILFELKEKDINCL